MIVVGGIYLGVAAAAGLPPFSSSGSSNSNVAAVQSLIPQQLKKGYGCTVKPNPAFGAVGEVQCKASSSTPASTPPDAIVYYHFSNVGTMRRAYSEFLSSFANVSFGAGDCGNFSSFKAGCETTYSPNSSSSNTTGRVVQYLYHGDADISTTVGKDLLLVDMVTSASSGNNLVKWWAQIPSPWVTNVG